LNGCRLQIYDFYVRHHFLSVSDAASEDKTKIIVDRLCLDEIGTVPAVSELCDLAAAFFDGVALVTIATDQSVKVLGAGQVHDELDPNLPARVARAASDLPMYAHSPNCRLPDIIAGILMPSRP